MTALLVFLATAALLAPARDPEGARVLIDFPASEAAALAAALALLGLLGRRLPRWVAGLVSAALLVVAAINLADALGPVTLGRPVELWWDLRHVPSLWGLARDSFGVLRAAAAVAAALALLLLLWAALAWLLSRRPGPRLVDGASLAAALLLAAWLPPRAAPTVVAQGAVAWQIGRAHV